jgi:uncharacterized membrane protein YdjX (TVP38/TMEM64 family)
MEEDFSESRDVKSSPGSSPGMPRGKRTYHLKSLGTLQNNALRLVWLSLLVAGVGLFFFLGGHHTLTFDRLVANKDALIARADAHPLLAPVVFVVAYLVLGLLGLPGSTMLNLAAGLLFDFWEGLCLVIFSSLLASSLAFWSFRYLFRSYVEEKVRSRFPRLEEDLLREGAYFVFALRLLPAIPFSFSNLVLAVSPVSFFTYVVMTMLALLPRHLLYVYAGLHLGDLQDPDDLYSPALIGVLAVLALLPWFLKWAAPKMKAKFSRKG